MKLHNVYYLCKKLVDVFNRKRIEAFEHNKSFHIVGWGEYVEALETIRLIPTFNDIATEAYENIPVFVRGDSTPLVDVNTMNRFVNINRSISQKMTTIIEIYEAMEIGGSGTGIDVKMPQCTELEDYISYLKDINFIFTQCPYLLCDNEKMRFLNVDVGSNWISFLIDVAAGSGLTSIIAKNLAKIVDYAIVLKSRYLSVKQQEEALKVAKKKTELAKEEIEIFKTLKSHYMEDTVAQLEKEIAPLNDGEERGKVEVSLEKLMTLLDKGVEIYASLDAPKDIQVLFPEIGETKKISETVLKFIEDKNEQVQED